MALTERQKRIVELVKECKTNKEIATRIIFSEKTIERELTTIFNEYDVENRTQLVGLLKS